MLFQLFAFLQYLCDQCDRNQHIKHGHACKVCAKFALSGTSKMIRLEKEEHDDDDCIISSPPAMVVEASEKEKLECSTSADSACHKQTRVTMMDSDVSISNIPSSEEVKGEQPVVLTKGKDVTDLLTTPDSLARDGKGSSVGQSLVECDGVPNDVPLNAQYSSIDGDCSVEVKSWYEGDLYLSGRHWGEFIKSTNTSVTVSYRRKCKGVYICKFCLCRICDASNQFCPTCSRIIEKRECPAMVYFVYKKQTQAHIIRHKGRHTCDCLHAIPSHGCSITRKEFKKSSYRWAPTKWASSKNVNFTDRGNAETSTERQQSEPAPLVNVEFNDTKFDSQLAENGCVKNIESVTSSIDPKSDLNQNKFGDDCNVNKTNVEEVIDIGQHVNVSDHEIRNIQPLTKSVGNGCNVGNSNVTSESSAVNSHLQYDNKCADQSIVDPNVSHLNTECYSKLRYLKPDEEREYICDDFADFNSKLKSISGFGKIEHVRKLNKFKSYTRKCSDRGCNGIIKITQKCKLSRVVVVGKIAHTCTDNNEPRSTRNVEEIPFDIDNNVDFIVDISEKENPFKQIADGRQWGNYIPIRNTPESKLYKRKCSGSQVCLNQNCPYRKREGKKNAFHTEVHNNKKVCRECNQEMVSLPCGAFKKILYDVKDPTHITIQHFGTHTCTPMPPKIAFPEKELADIFRLIHTVKPTEAQNLYLRQVFDSTPHALNEKSKSVADLKKIQNLKLKVVNELKLVDTVENVMDKAKECPDVIIEKTDKEILCITSYTAIAFMNDLSSSNDQPVGSDGFVHMDFLPKRIKSKRVLGLHYFVPQLKETITLAKFYCHEESDTVVSLCLNWLNTSISKVYGIGSILLPFGGWMLDEAGCLQKGLEIVYGPDVQIEIATCQSHYMASVLRNSNKGVGSDQKIHYFRTLGKALMKSEDENQYNSVYAEIIRFINDRPGSRH